MMMRAGSSVRASTLLVLTSLLCLACPGPTTTPRKDGGLKDPDVVTSNWNFYTLDDVVVAGSGDPLLGPTVPQLALAVGPNDRVGVAYFRPNGVYTTKPAYDVRYVEWSAGTVGASENVRNITGQTGAFPQYLNPEGISLVFQANGQPAVAYLGGHFDGTPTFWFQADAAVATRNGSGWQPESLAARDSSDAPYSGPGQAVANSGQVVGLFPALAVDGTTLLLAYRDVHNGQSAGSGDYTASDFEFAYGTTSSWQHQMIQSGADDKEAYGGHSDIVVGPNHDVAVVNDHVSHDADGPGEHPMFRLRQSGTWKTPQPGHDLFEDLSTEAKLTNTQSGASLAYDSQKGYGVAAVNRGRSILYYTQSTDPLVSWTVSDPVVGEGTSGWYPSLAFHPTEHEPHIAFYFCSASSGKNEGQCTQDDELRVANHLGDHWVQTSVDPDGAFQPQLGFLSNGKRVIAYRVAAQPNVVRLAVEK